ncbi:26803_t:CDS:1 [Dentiscutata erythropus]|uniref:26803_t:CDS:1 n=1 Tax=Dentiscutata erythropus TaxID=1348616 RepID=A0A9N9F044_9GLOM|nr:26803_t:CDS:1 [Dentiscutata erythropus]
MDIWLPVAHSDKLVSNLGRIKNNKGVVLKGNICKRSGYVKTDININGIRKIISIHILVARAFIPNPEIKPYVNHINGIRHDNRVDNLEWVTPKENAKRRNTGRKHRKIVQKTLEGNVVQVWDSIRLAGNTLKIIGTNISQCCRGKQKTAGGWLWMYYEDYIEKDPNEEWKEIELNSRKFRVSSLGMVQLASGVITQGSLNLGYLKVNGHLVHRLVALAFCPKEEGKEYVNHIDNDSTNNKASNLEWCTPKENVQHAVRLMLRNGWMRQRAVKQILEGGFAREFPSLAEARRITGIDESSIRKVCRGLQTHAGGCRWEYVSTISHNHEDSINHSDVNFSEIGTFY